VSLSLNEFQALIKKAAHGAGLDWGSAAEIARAARLQAQSGDFDVAAFVACLVRHYEQGAGVGRPTQLGDHWQGDGPLCPLMVGLCLCDWAHQLPQQIQGVQHPSLLHGFLALINRQRDDRLVAHVLGDAVQIQPATVAQTPMQSRVELTDQQQADLDFWASKTYAPATEASRLAGAGAGVSDND